jgi:hypothetical protein
VVGKLPGGQKRGHTRYGYEHTKVNAAFMASDNKGGENCPEMRPGLQKALAIYCQGKEKL